MNKIVAYISPDFNPALFEKIAEMLRTQQIQTTNNINCATCVIEPHKQSNNLTVAMICNVAKQELTIAKLAEQQVNKTQQELERLIEQCKTFKIPEVLDFPDIQLLEQKPRKKHKIRNFVSQQNLKKYNQTIQNTNQRFFLTRTKHK